MIVVVLPAYNEATAIPRLLQRTRSISASLDQPLRVVVVDDGSRDGTAEAAERFDADDFPVEVVSHAANRGLHGALDTGLRRALSLCGPEDWIVTMDADDTHPPDLLAQMMSAGRDGHDLVIASRFRKGAEWHGATWDRVLFSYGVSWLFRLMWPMKGVRDYTCGYRAYRAALVTRGYDRWGVGLVSEPSFACMPDLLWKLSRLGPSIGEIPLVLYYDRKPGDSKMNVTRTIRRTMLLIVKRRLGIN